MTKTETQFNRDELQILFSQALLNVILQLQHITYPNFQNLGISLNKCRRQFSCAHHPSAEENPTILPSKPPTNLNSHNYQTCAHRPNLCHFMIFSPRWRWISCSLKCKFMYIRGKNRHLATYSLL